MKTMKSTMARLFALCLTVAMVLSMATMGAFATNVTIGQKGNITINSAASDNGAEVDLYKIMNVNLVNANGTVQPKDPMYSWVDKVANWLNANATYKAYINADNNNAVTDSFKNATAAQLSKFFHDMKAAIEPGKDGKIELVLTPATKEPITISSTSQEITGMEMGQYLVIAEKSAYVYSPATVTLAPVWDGENEEWVLNDAAVTVKGKGGIGKEVVGGDLGYAVGDTVTYRLDVAIPVYPKAGPDEEIIHKRFEVGDTMGKGLTFGGIKNVKIYANTSSDSYNEQELVAEQTEGLEGPNYAVKETLEEGTNRVIGFEINFKYDNLKATVGADTYVHVVYTATLNEDAFEKDALGNDAYLGVNTDPYDNDSYEKTEVEKEVYTYGINVTKVDATNNSAVLPGAKFKLYKKEMVKDEETGEEKEVEKAVAFTHDEAKNVYIKTTDAVGTVEATILVTDDEGEIQLQGLDFGTYYLKEIKAPNGYQLPNDKDAVTTIVLTDDKIGTGEGAKDGQDGVLEQEKTSATGKMVVANSTSIINNNVISFKLGNNKPGFELPTTGGMGTVLFTAGGLVIMACGAALVLVTLKKKKAED